MRLLLFGGTGQVGTEFRALGRRLDPELIAPTRAEVDVTDTKALEDVIATSRCDAVVNAAAYTEVDRAETEQSLAFLINARVPSQLALITANLGVPILHLSTDYVFDGRKGAPYVENDYPAPLNIYGQSKLEGECAIKAAKSETYYYKNFVGFQRLPQKFCSYNSALAAERDCLEVVVDQRGCPTAASDVAKTCLAVVVECLREPTARPMGLITLRGQKKQRGLNLLMKFVNFASRRQGKRPKVVPISTADFPTTARRAPDTRLDSAAIAVAFGVASRPWRQAMAETMEQLLPNGGGS